jgi:hypothetical protein
MAALFDTIDEGVRRTTGLIAATTAYYTATWWVYLPALPPTGVTRTLYFLASSAARATQSIAVTQDSTGLVRLVVAGTPSAGVVVAPGWHALAVGRRAPANFIELYIDNNNQASTATVPFSSWTFDELYLGVDPRVTGVVQSVAYFREWAAFLGFFTPEWQSPVPVLTDDLDTDTPFHTDLVDLTPQHHDWSHVGGGVQTFASVPVSAEGALGGWWFYSNWTVPLTAPECILRAQTADVLGSTTARLIAEVRIVPQGGTMVGDTVTAVHHDVHLRYGSGPNALDITDLVVHDPFTDPAIGYVVPPAYSVAGPRNDFCAPYRYALVFGCSTWDAETSTFAVDGFARLYLNDSLLLAATDVLIPRRPDGGAIQYTIGILSDCDRVWARTVAAVPPTTPEGAFTSGLPSGLVYFDEFESGAYPGWSVTEVFPAAGGGSTPPRSYADCGGDNSWGLSVFGQGPTVGDPGNVAGYTGLWRLLRFPPMAPVEPEEPDDSACPSSLFPIDEDAHAWLLRQRKLGRG